MEQILPLSLRPKTLSALVGQRTLVAAMRKQAATRLPLAWLFHGETGTGKTTVARIVALALQCTHQKLWGDPCKACWVRWDEYDIHETNASEVNGVEDIGKLATLGRHHPLTGGSRVFILDEAQLMTTNAQNLLLKHFEEATATWIICTTNPNKILATLRRRCMVYQLRPLDFEDVKVFLAGVTRRIQLKRPLRDLLHTIRVAEVASPALLLMAVEKYAAGFSAAEAVAGIDGSGGAIDTLLICKAVTAGNWPELNRLLSEVSAGEARYVRASVGGWLRGVLRREKVPGRQVMVADCLQELHSMAPLDDSSLLQWLWGTLYKICRRFRVSKSKGY